MTDYELTRRDAVAALAAAGVGTAAIGALTLSDDESADGHGPIDRHELETMEAVARVVYPSEVEGIGEFVERYVVGRARDRPERARGIADAVAELDEYARAWYDEAYVDLDPDVRDEALRKMGVQVADSDPEGSGTERVRFYLVNELLYALYTTPTGATLVGLENPQGYPGGTGSYQHGP